MTLSTIDPNNTANAHNQHAQAISEQKLIADFQKILQSINTASINNKKSVTLSYAILTEYKDELERRGFKLSVFAQNEKLYTTIYW